MPTPAHSLEQIQRIVSAGGHQVTYTAMLDATALGLDDTDIVACVCALDEGDFYKSMPSTKKPGHFQDVYKPSYCGHRLYMKLDLTDTAVVISFKEDESR